MIVPRLYLLLLTFFCLLSTLILRVLSLLSSSWATFSHLELGEITMSLTSCSHCPASTQSWAWDCFQSQFCDIDTGVPAACDAFSDGKKASFCFLGLEGLSLLLFLMQVQKAVALVSKRDFGPILGVYCLAGLQFLMEVAAVAAWKFVSGAEFHSESQGLSISSGFKLATSAVTLNGITLLLYIWVFCTRSESREYWEHKESVLCRLRVVWWLIVAFGLQLVTYGLILWSLAYPYWVHRSLPTESWSGGLLKCHECPFQAQRVGWDCFAGAACAAEKSNNSACIMYENLRNAGRTFFALELTSLSLMLLWSESILYLFVGREVGVSLLNYAYPALSLCLHLSAVVSWFLKSRVGISTECRTEDSAEVFLCRDSGPAIAVAALGTMAAAAGLFTLAYWYRGDYKEGYHRSNSLEEIEMRVTS